MILRPHSTPSFESYGTSSMKSIRAKPMTPRPIFRVAYVISSICLTGYEFMSMTSSSMRTVERIVPSSFFQSTSHPPLAVRFM